MKQLKKVEKSFDGNIIKWSKRNKNKLLKI